MSTADPTDEKKIQTGAIAYAKDRWNIEVIRMVFRPGLRAGWPDVLFLIPGGHPLFIEFKSRGKKPTPLQQRRLDYLDRAGYNRTWCDNLRDAKTRIDEAVHNARSR